MTSTTGACRGYCGGSRRPYEAVMSEASKRPDWRRDGVRVNPGDELDPNTPQTPGMSRAAAVDHARAGSRQLWAGTMRVDPDGRTGPHHHGHLETVLYVVRGRARMRWGERLELMAEAGAGDFIYVPPYVPHQEINASAGDDLECVVVRSDQEPVVVNLAIEPVERPEIVSAHPRPRGGT